MSSTCNDLEGHSCSAEHPFVRRKFHARTSRIDCDDVCRTSYEKLLIQHPGSWPHWSKLVEQMLQRLKVTQSGREVFEN